jgi:hypothetical protein
MFTDYRPNCDLNPPSWGDFQTRQNIIKGGMAQMAGDRSLAVQRAGESKCVDTMVPELNMRVCTWEGCKTIQSQPVGLGTGRLYLPSREDLAAGDPDTLAIESCPPLFGTFSQLYARNTNLPTPKHTNNRYSAPYGRS